MAEKTETVAQRQRREAVAFASSNADLTKCNDAARRDAAELRKKSNEAAKVALDAVARAFGGSGNEVPTPRASAKG